MPAVSRVVLLSDVGCVERSATHRHAVIQDDATQYQLARGDSWILVRSDGTLGCFDGVATLMVRFAALHAPYILAVAWGAWSGWQRTWIRSFEMSQFVSNWPVAISESW